MLGEIPVTFHLFALDNFSDTKLFSTREDLCQKKALASQLFGNPKVYNPILEIDENSTDGEFRSALADNIYIDAISNNKITLIKGSAEDVNSNGVVLDDGRVIECDVIIMCTGYSRSMSFLSKQIKTLIKYEEDSRMFGMSLYRAMIHPDLQGFFIIGNLWFPLDCKFELQAEIAIKWFLGTLNVTREEMLEGIALEDNMRAMANINNAGY